MDACRSSHYRISSFPGSFQSKGKCRSDRHQAMSTLFVGINHDSSWFVDECELVVFVYHRKIKGGLLVAQYGKISTPHADLLSNDVVDDTAITYPSNFAHRSVKHRMLSSCWIHSQRTRVQQNIAFSASFTGSGK